MNNSKEITICLVLLFSFFFFISMASAATGISLSTPRPFSDTTEQHVESGVSLITPPEDNVNITLNVSVNNSLTSDYSETTNIWETDDGPIENVDDILHNDLGGLQGGTSGQYYHLTSSQYSYVDTNLFDFLLPADLSNISANFSGSYDWTAESPWFEFNGTHLELNETAVDANILLVAGPHTVDTNASTACSSSEVLLGNGSCYDTAAFFDDTDTTYTFNDTQMNSSGGYITILESWLLSLFYTEPEVDALISNISLTPGPQGPPGINGTDGQNLTLNNIIDNGDGTYTWNFSDGTLFTTSNLTGPQGLPGIDGINGTNGIDGINGTNGIDGLNLTLNNIINNGDGTYTWNFSDGTLFTTGNLTGPQGIPGINGTNGIDGINGTDGIDGQNLTLNNIINNGDGTYTWNFSDGTLFTTGNLTGPQGLPGVDGINGTDGIDGINGTDGIDGVNGTFTDIINTTQMNNTGGVLSIMESWLYSLFYSKAEVDSLAEVTIQQEVLNVVSSGGTASATSGIIDFEIKEISVNTTSGTQFRFEAIEASTGAIIDKDRKLHTTSWRIEKNYPINDSVNISITSANPDDSFTITIKYMDNFY